MGDNYVKIAFRFYSDILDEETVETMWAEVVDKDKDLYKLDNIPFYAPLVASNDVVLAQFDENEEMLLYHHTVKYSGNSTIHIVLLTDNEDIDIIRLFFDKLGCISEKLNDKYFAMEVPLDLDYKDIKEKLIEMELSGIISYQESCISEKHRNF